MSEREERYAEAQRRFFGAFLNPPPVKPTIFWANAARAVMAVADAEQAELRAEVERLREACIPLTDLVQELDLARQNLHHAYAMSDAHSTRAESAEGEVERLRAQVEAVLKRADESVDINGGWLHVAAIRAALSSSEPVGES